jgi:hypothetical protein
MSTLAARTHPAHQTGRAQSAAGGSSRRAKGCPPHYWNIAVDDDGERWDCRQCGAVNRPTPPRFISWGERGCTWSREERILAGLEADV